MAVLNLFVKKYFIAFHSFILQAVTISTPERAANGSFAITPPKRNIEASSPKEWIIPVSLVSEPDLIATLVLAIAAVAGTPPKKGIIMFPIPCATSSRSASKGSFFIFEAEAPQSRLSIIPKAAIETAGEIKSLIIARFIPEKESLASGRRVLGISPTTAILKPARLLTNPAMIIATREEGTKLFHFFG